jgi:hypothetical protein
MKQAYNQKFLKFVLFNLKNTYKAKKKSIIQLSIQLDSL